MDLLQADHASATGPDEELSDDELVRRVRCGEELAFRALVVRYHTSFVRIAEAYLPGDPRIGDIARDAWARILDSIGRVDHKSSFRTWLFHNVVMAGP